MDWNKVRDSPGEPMAPRLELVEMCWRMGSLQKSTRILSCGIYRTNAPGLEVRAGYSDEDLLRSQRTAEIGSAREIAEAWRQAVIAQGGFTDLSQEQTAAKSDAQADSESLRERISELRRAGARMDPDIDAQLTQEVSDALRAAGHEALLLRYAAALQWFNKTRAELERANAGGQINETAQEAMNAALEDFERVEAEALAVFDQLDAGDARRTDNDILAVLSQLRDLEEFMTRHAVIEWPRVIREARLEGSTNRQELKRRTLDMYKGTMGSIRDLIISRVNGHNLDNEKEANTELDRRVDELWQRANVL